MIAPVCANREARHPPRACAARRSNQSAKLAGGDGVCARPPRGSPWAKWASCAARARCCKLNQKDGIDCPGCAWPEPDGERSHFEFCEEGAKHVADEATTKRVTPEFFAKWSVADLAEQSDLWLNQQGRITHPMVLARRRDHYEPIDWPDAFALIAQRTECARFT